MYQEVLSLYAREKGLSLREATQTFMQVIVLRHLSDPHARFMGGTALVLGYGNPRFSEDVDFTQVSDPANLKGGLVKTRIELEGWFQSPVALVSPKAGARTWRLTARLGRAESIRLHVDSQSCKAHTSRPVVINYPSIPSFICEAIEVNEIMAEKIIAVAFRRYLGGRDLFDLWFHWLQADDWASRKAMILDLVDRKIRERSLRRTELAQVLKSRLSEKLVLQRAHEEWKRYLPPDFQRPSVLHDVVERCRRLTELFP